MCAFSYIFVYCIVCTRMLVCLNAQINNINTGKSAKEKCLQTGSTWPGFIGERVHHTDCQDPYKGFGKENSYNCLPLFFTYDFGWGRQR